MFGEHPRYHPQYIADCMAAVYAVRAGRGQIRRVSVNAGPLDHAGYATIVAAGIGTYQIFQETYHHATYARVHPAGTRKSDYLWRLDGVARAVEAGCGDVGIGALLGLYDWRFEVLALVAHALHLQRHYGAGPHTISFPRLRPASGVRLDEQWLVRDHDFKRLVAILRLAAPYAGLILTAREPAAVRREVLGFGVSQIDAGSRIELGGYTEAGDAQVIEREQFQLGDLRPLDEVLGELLADGYLPSFCTACYRLGRTGEHFMEWAVPGFIQNFCTPNALSTLTEYLVDYASAETAPRGCGWSRRSWRSCPRAGGSRPCWTACGGSARRTNGTCTREGGRGDFQSGAGTNSHRKSSSLRGNHVAVCRVFVSANHVRPLAVHATKYAILPINVSKAFCTTRYRRRCSQPNRNGGQRKCTTCSICKVWPRIAGWGLGTT